MEPNVHPINPQRGPVSAHLAAAPGGAPGSTIVDRRNPLRIEQGRRRRRYAANVERLGVALGWFSVGLGVVQILAPRGLARLIGTGASPALMRLLGLREIATGIGILTHPRPHNWVRARVAGDALDLALLARALADPAASRGKVAVATAAVAGVTALDAIAASTLARGAARLSEMVEEDGSIRVRHTIAVTRSADECYRTWRDFTQFPRFMKHLESVEIHDAGRSHWVAKGPAGTRVEWDSELAADEPGALLAWRSLPGAEVENSGVVRFVRAPGGRGTVIDVELIYVPPAGITGSLVASLFGEAPHQQLREDLRRFKQIVETGEIATTVGQPAGRRSLVYGAMRRSKESRL